MAIDENDNLYVSDLHNKVIKMAPDAQVSDFITGVSNPYWVTFGEDGYLYVSTSYKTIEKFVFDGTAWLSSAQELIHLGVPMWIDADTYTSQQRLLLSL
ncbi:MAG: hypothetical protein AB7E42_05570 [Anaerotignaceae bacterium]